VNESRTASSLDASRVFDVGSRNGQQEVEEPGWQYLRAAADGNHGRARVARASASAVNT
jgi:hypothetical protein